VLQHSFDRVSLSWQGIDLTPGLAAGAPILPQNAGESWTEKPDGLGSVVRFYKPGIRGRLSLLINPAHRVHHDLLILAQTDRVTRAVRGPLILRDRNTAEIITYTAAYLVGEPDDGRGAAVAPVTWVFAYSDIRRKPVVAINNAV
jgi:hypothetical protein